jgi:hypothetical protein
MMSHALAIVPMTTQNSAESDKMLKWLRTISVIFSIVIFPFQTQAFQSDPQIFSDLNMSARSAYAKLKERSLYGETPVFLVSDKVTLIKGRHLGAISYTPPIYEQLKSISHITLGIAGAGLSALETPGDLSWKMLLGDLRSKAQLAKSRIDQASFSAMQKARQIQIIDASIAFIDRALSNGILNSADLKTYSLSMAPLVLANTTEAANAQIESLDLAVKTLAKQLTPDEWTRAMAVITGPKTAREGNLQSQYFLFSWNEKSMGERVIYIENIFEDDQALAVLQTVLTDRKLGSLFFNDPSRMERDLLSDAATAELLRRFGRLGAQPH